MAETATASQPMPWLKDYPAHIEWDMPLSDGTVRQLWEESVAQFADREFCDFLDKTYTYGQMDALVKKAARGLQDRGVTKGTRVGLFLPNCPYYPVFYYAVMSIGGVVVNFNPTYPTDMVKDLANLAGVEVMVSLDLEAVYSLVEPSVGTTSVQTLVVCPFAGVLPGIKGLLFPLVAKGRGLPLAKPAYSDKIVRYRDFMANAGNPSQVDIEPNDIAALQFTGGTTGLPKAATLTHNNLFVNIQQAGNWFPRITGDGDSILAVLPFFHVFAMTVCLNYMVARGGRVIMHPRYETEQCLEAFSKKKPTLFAGVPAIYTAICNHPDVLEGKVDFSSLKYSISGGASLPIAVKHKFEALSGCSLTEGYGLSETSPIACTQPIPEDGKERREREATIGIPVPGTRIDIISLDDGETVLGYGEENRGEVCISGPQVMQGYWQNDAETKECFDSEGRFHTGDIGYMDEEGYTFIVDRKKDMILTGNGMNVYPRDIEEAIYEHPAIIEAAICGIPDEGRGERILASIVLKDGEALDHEGLRAYLKDKVPSYALPEITETLEELPKSQIGKILKKDIRSNYIAAQSLSQGG